MAPLPNIAADSGAGFKHERFHFVAQKMGGGGEADRTGADNNHRKFSSGHAKTFRLEGFTGATMAHAAGSPWQQFSVR